MSNVEDIKERLSIEDVVSGYVTLKPAGSNLKGKCPFHAEKTPSFVVSPMRQTYHCFGCGVGGDIFTFIQEIEGLDFRGSLKMLADKAGVVLTKESQGMVKDDKDKLFMILEIATQFYEQKFQKNNDAQEYLSKRGVTKKTTETFRIGFAPDSWSDILMELTKRGFSKKDIENAGLIKKGDKGEYDRFRSRIMFPITDSVGRVVAFSGRIFNKSEDKTGKYINSPETSLYHKSKILYGYDRARQAIRKTNFAILVEGQMDLIMTHQAGYTNTVALSGTALTHEHLTLLGRMSHNLVIALDADNAGMTSAEKSAHAALLSGFDVKIASLPDGSDPADILADGDTKVWKNAIKQAQHIIDFLLTYYRDKTKEERAFKQNVEHSVLPYILDINSEIDKSHFIQRIAAQLSVSEEVLRLELSKIPHTSSHESELSIHTAKIGIQATHNAEEEVILLYLWQEYLKKPFIDVSLLRKQIEEVLTPIGFNAMCEKLKNNNEAAFRLELLYKDEESIKQAVFELLERLNKNLVGREIEKTATSLRKAESEKNTKDIIKYEKHYQKLLHKRMQFEKHL